MTNKISKSSDSARDTYAMQDRLLAPAVSATNNAEDLDLLSMTTEELKSLREKGKRTTSVAVALIIHITTTRSLSLILTTFSTSSSWNRSIYVPLHPCNPWGRNLFEGSWLFQGITVSASYFSQDVHFMRSCFDLGNGWLVQWTGWVRRCVSWRTSWWTSDAAILQHSGISCANILMESNADKALPTMISMPPTKEHHSNTTDWCMIL